MDAKMSQMQTMQSAAETRASSMHCKSACSSSGGISAQSSTALLISPAQERQSYK